MGVGLTVLTLNSLFVRIHSRPTSVLVTWQWPPQRAKKRRSRAWKRGKECCFHFLNELLYPSINIYIYIYRKTHNKTKETKKTQKNDKKKHKKIKSYIWSLPGKAWMCLWLFLFNILLPLFPLYFFCKWDYVQMPGKLTQKGESTQLEMIFTPKASKPKGRTGCVIKYVLSPCIIQNVIF